MVVAAQGLRSSARNSEDTGAVEEGLDIGAEGPRPLEEEDVVLLGGRDGVVVEMIDNDAGAVIGKVDVSFEEEGADSAGSRGLARKGEQDVAVLVQEVQDVLGGQVRAESYAIESIGRRHVI